MKFQFIGMLSLLAVVGCGGDDTETTGTTTTGTTTTMTTETGTTTTGTTTTMTTETGTTTTTETGTTTTTTTTTTTPTTTSTTMPEFSPIEGMWNVTMVTFGKNECDLEDDGEPIGFGLMNVDAYTFTLRDMEDPEITFECTTTSSTAMTYACTSVAMTDPTPFGDAVLTMTIAPEVLFSSDSTAEMPFDLTVECVGSDCAKLKGMGDMAVPCLTEATFEIQKAGGPT